MKKIISVLLVTVLSLSMFSINTFAASHEESSGITNTHNSEESTVSPYAFLTTHYKITNKSNLGTCRIFKKNLTSDWANSTGYVYSKTISTTFTLGADNVSLLDGIKATGVFTASKSFSTSVSTTIPADPSKLSILALDGEYTKYYATLNTCQGHSEYASCNYVATGSTYIYEPTGMGYVYVKYQ